MGIAKTYAAQLVGLKAEIVTIEVDITNGLHSFSIVGLGDRAIDEARDRISAAIKNSGYVSPKQKNQKVVISLAPADIKKEGPSFDLAMAMAYLKASGDVEFDSERIIFMGELSLEGSIRRVGGLLPILCQLPALGFSQACIPAANESEASLARNICIYKSLTLADVTSHVSGTCNLPLVTPYTETDPVPPQCADFHAIRGNESAKRGLEIAAAGAHNILLWGPPGTGKTMLAQSFPSILPALSFEQAVEVTGIHSLARTPDSHLVVHPPFRSPHHTASYPSIVGGGSFPRPGEITLAHRGVLFLDELPEFDRDVLEALRQPLEDRVITISRAKGTVTYPAQCILVASMNPCPCGKGQNGGCTCSPNILRAYNRRISGPILDRIDLHIEVHKVDYEKLSLQSADSVHSGTIRERVIRARAVQADRFKRHHIVKFYNSEMSAEDIERCVQMNDDTRRTLASMAKKLKISGRSFHRIIKVAQTIADLEGSVQVRKEHLFEALQYRHKSNES